MSTWRVGAGFSSTSPDFYSRCVKQTVDKDIQRCIGDQACINGQIVVGRYDESAVQLNADHQKSTNTTMITFCYPDCDYPGVTCQMPVEYAGEQFAISRIAPARWRGWTCVYLKACSKATADLNKLGEATPLAANNFDISPMRTIR